MTENRSVLSAPHLDDMMSLQQRLDAAEALARERLETIQNLEWERDRLRLDLQERAAAASSPDPRLAEAELLTSAPQAVPGRPGLARRAALALYRMFRPLVRPFAWRVRHFLVGELRREIAEVSAQQELLLERSKSGTGIMDAAFVASVERLLLTLALEQRRDCTRPGPGAGLSRGESDG